MSRSLTLDPASWIGHYNLAVVLYKTGDLPAAEHSLRRVLELSKANAPARILLHHALRNALLPLVTSAGLDFHPYCHAVVHWNLPTNPIDLEQREGRVNRFAGHAIRRNVAAAHWDDVTW